MAPRGGDADAGNVQNVQVAVRCRPLSAKELKEGSASVFEKVGAQTARLVDPASGTPTEMNFDFVYDEQTPQARLLLSVVVTVESIARCGRASLDPLPRTRVVAPSDARAARVESGRLVALLAVLAW